MNKIGHQDTLIFDLDHEQSSGLLRVDIWSGGVLLTPFDNKVFLPQFISSLERELKNIVSGKDFIYFNHGPTTDDVVGNLDIKDDIASLSFEVNGQTVEASMPITELVAVYGRVISELRSVYS